MVDDVMDGALARVGALLAARSAPVLIGVVGRPGAGKTTFAAGLVARLVASGTHAVHVPMDGFHLADVELRRLGRSGRKGAPDTFDPGGYAAILGRIRAGEEVWAPAFERTLEDPVAQSIAVPAATEVVVSEGNYLLLADAPWRAVRAQFDEVWTVRVDEDVRLRRLIARHVRFGKSPDDARAWALGSDQRNAQVVAAVEADADLVLDV